MRELKYGTVPLNVGCMVTLPVAESALRPQQQEKATGESQAYVPSIGSRAYNLGPGWLKSAGACWDRNRESKRKNCKWSEEKERCEKG